MNSFPEKIIQLLKSLDLPKDLAKLVGRSFSLRALVPNGEAHPGDHMVVGSIGSADVCENQLTLSITPSSICQIDGVIINSIDGRKPVPPDDPPIWLIHLNDGTTLTCTKFELKPKSKENCPCSH